MDIRFLPKIIFFCFFFALLFSCDKQESEIGDVPVDFYININDPLYRDLRVVGNSTTVVGGHAGIVIYRHTQDEFLAFDRLCPFERKVSCRLKPTDDDLYYRCTCCDTPYLLLEGIGQSENDKSFPGTNKFLKQYRTYYDGVGRLRITN